MIAVASIVVHFFKDEQCMVSKYNLLYVVYRTAQTTVGRMMKTDGIVDFFVVLSGMSLNPTSKTSLAVFTRPSVVHCRRGDP